MTVSLGYFVSYENRTYQFSAKLCLSYKKSYFDTKEKDLFTSINLDFCINMGRACVCSLISYLKK